MTTSQWRKWSLESLQNETKELQTAMLQFQAETDYPNAQATRVKLQQLKIYGQMNKKYDQQCRQNQQKRENQLVQCDKRWKEKLQEYEMQCQDWFKQFQSRCNKKIQQRRNSMQLELSTVVKQSIQLLNLRKQEEYASRQKNFTQAHSVQQKIKKVYEEEKAIFMKNRQRTIDQALKNLKVGQMKQKQTMQHKIKLAIEDFFKQKFMEVASINQRYNNLAKQLKSQFERQILSLNSELKNLGGKSPKRRTKYEVYQDSLVN